MVLAPPRCIFLIYTQTNIYTYLSIYIHSYINIYFNVVGSSYLYLCIFTRTNTYIFKDFKGFEPP